MARPKTQNEVKPIAASAGDASLSLIEQADGTLVVDEPAESSATEALDIARLGNGIVVENELRICSGSAMDVPTNVVQAAIAQRPFTTLFAAANRDGKWSLVVADAKSTWKVSL